MESESTKNSHDKPRDVTAFTGWGTIAGAAVGLAIGLFTRHWLGWTVGLALAGWIAGAFIDRAQRN